MQKVVRGGASVTLWRLTCLLYESYRTLASHLCIPLNNANACIEYASLLFYVLLYCFYIRLNTHIMQKYDTKQEMGVTKEMFFFKHTQAPKFCYRWTLFETCCYVRLTSPRLADKGDLKTRCPSIRRAALIQKPVLKCLSRHRRRDKVRAETGPMCVKRSLYRQLVLRDIL